MREAVPRVFFSYSRTDSEFVLKVANALRAEGRSVWVDQLDIPKGARWDDEVEKALKASNCLLAVLSPASTTSQNVQDEVSYAIEEKRKVLPILVRECNIPFRLKRLQYIDFTGDFDAAYRQLTAALDALGTKSTPADTLPKAQTVPSQAAPPPALAARSSQRLAALRRFPARVAAALVAVAVLAGGYALFARKGVAPNIKPSRPSMSTPREAVNPTAPEASVVSDGQVKDFVARYLAAQKNANAAELLQFYAARVDYFGQNDVGWDFILKDKQSYYRRWPQVENRLAGEVRVNRSGGEGTVLASYDIEYRVSNHARAISKAGSAHDELDLRWLNGELLIVGQRQRVLGRSAGAN